MSDEASKFDPRFDPAFQRGFDGPTSAVARPVVREVVADAPTEVPRETAAAASGHERIIVEPAELLAGEPTSRRPNPFLLGLLGSAVLLIGGGFWLISRLSDLFSTSQGSADYDYITLQAMTIAAPMLIVLGIATGLGVAFVYAVRYKRP